MMMFLICHTLLLLLLLLLFSLRVLLWPFVELAALVADVMAVVGKIMQIA